MKNMKKALQNLTVPINRRVKQNKRKLTFHNGIYIFSIDPAALCTEKFGGKDDIGDRDASLRPITVQDAAVYKQAAALRQDELFCSDKASDASSFGIDELDLRVPMPIDTVKVKFPHVFPIKAERELRFFLRLV